MGRAGLKWFLDHTLTATKNYVMSPASTSCVFLWTSLSEQSRLRGLLARSFIAISAQPFRHGDDYAAERAADEQDAQPLAGLHSHLMARVASSAAVHGQRFNNANGVKPQPLAGMHNTSMARTRSPGTST